MNSKFKIEFEKDFEEARLRNDKRREELKREWRGVQIIATFYFAICIVIILALGYLLIKYTPELWEALIQFLKNN